MVGFEVFIFYLAKVIFVVCGILVVLLDTKENIKGRILSTFNSIWNIYIYFNQQFYDRCAISLYSLWNSLHAYLKWKIYKEKYKGAILPITNCNRSNVINCLVFISIISIVYSLFLLYYFPNTSYIYWRSVNAGVSLIAQRLIANKKTDAWIYFLINSISYTLIFLLQKEYILMLQPLIFIPINIRGYLTWKKKIKEEPST